MTTPITPVELIDDDQKKLVLVAQQNGLQPETAQNLQASFAPLFEQARSIIEKSKAIQVTDVSQKLEMDLAKKCRIALKNVRVAGDKIRKEQKEESLKKGRAIDGFFAILDHLVSTEETRLAEQEKFAEIKEAERKAGLKIEREELLKPFAIDLTGYALGEMSAETFEQLLTGTKLAHEARLEAARKAEADRIAKEAAEQAERIRIQAENERLRKEAEEKQAALLAEREAVRIEAERVEKARIAAEQEAARVLAEERRKADEAAAIERQRVAKEQAEAAEKAKREREEIEAKAAAERAELKRKADEEAKVAAEAARKEREAIEAKAKAEREAAEEEARKERLRQQALREVERQKAETAQKEAQAKLTAEREAREKLEAEQNKARQIEAARAAAEAEVARKAAAAPDREKLLAFAAAIKAVEIPALSTETGIALTATIKASHEKFVAWINDKAGAL